MIRYNENNAIQYLAAILSSDCQSGTTLNGLEWCHQDRKSLSMEKCTGKMKSPEREIGQLKIIFYRIVKI